MNFASVARCLFALGALVLSAEPMEGGEPQRYNVLMIAADDLRCDLGCYGNTLVETPNLDSLAARGLLFERAYCQQAVCNPSRASLFTGRYPDELEVWDLRTHFRRKHPGIVTLPQQFKRNGWHVEGIGKLYHNNPKGMQDPESWSTPSKFEWGTHALEYALPENSPGSVGKRSVFERGPVEDDAYRDGKITELAVEAIGRLREKPFFLGVGFWRPHAPFLAPEKYWEHLDGKKLPPPEPAAAPEGAPAIAFHDNREIRGYTPVPKQGDIPTELVGKMRHGYWASINYMDANIGKLLAALEEHGLEERTIVVFWSDHGYHLGEHGLWCKTSNFELDARVPLLLVPPAGSGKAARTAAPAELVDIYPTLLEMCGLPAAEGARGRSLAPLLADPEAPLRAGAITQHPRPNYYGDFSAGEKPEAMGYSIRTARFRYTEWRKFREDREVLARELYDHAQDEAETRNVVDDARYAEFLPELEKLLAEKITLGRGEWKSTLRPPTIPSP